MSTLICAMSLICSRLAMATIKASLVLAFDGLELLSEHR